MRRLWPLLLTFAAGLFAPHAHAKRVARCACPQRVVLPPPGERGIFRAAVRDALPAASVERDRT